MYKNYPKHLRNVLALLTYIIPAEAIVENVNSRTVPPPVVVVVVHPSAVCPMLVKPALRAVNIKEYYFFLKNPNFDLGFAGAAASAAIHSRNTPASHVI